MKKIIALGLFALLIGAGCQKKDSVLLERIAKLEERLAVLEKRLPQAQPTQPEEQVSAYDIPVGKSLVLGNKNAPLTLVAFTDIQCPFCDRAHKSFVKAAAQDPGVKVVIKHFPLSFHDKARPASKRVLAAQEQGEDCGEQMLDKLFSAQKELSDAKYLEIAKSITCKKHDGKVSALDVKKWEGDLKAKDAEYEEQIKADTALGMQSGTRGTPTFYVGTQGKSFWKLSQRTLEAVKEMAKAKNLVPGGGAQAAGTGAGTGTAASGGPGH